MSQPNYEAIGRYHTLKAERQKLLAEISASSSLVKELNFHVEGYNPPYTGFDGLPNTLEKMEAILPRLKENVHRVNELWKQMSSLRAQYNIEG